MMELAERAAEGTAAMRPELWLDVNRERPQRELETPYRDADSSPERKTAEPKIYYVVGPFLSGRQLGSPLKIELVETEEGFLEAFSPMLDLRGVGRTIAEAIMDLRTIVEALWTELEPTPRDQLHVSAVRRLARIRAVLAP